MQSSVIGQVIRQVSAGDRSAFRILFNAYYSRVYRFAERILKDSLYADEVAQAVFVGLWRKREMLDPDRNFENYLYVLSRHAVTDFMRLNRRARLAEGLEAVTDTGLSGDSTDAVAEYHLIQSQIDKIVEGMPEQRRKVYCMSRNDANLQKDSRTPSESGTEYITQRDEQFLLHSGCHICDFLKKFPVTVGCEGMFCPYYI